MPTSHENESFPLNGRFLSGYAPRRDPAPEALRPLVTLQLAPRPEVIVGESSLLPFHFLRTGDRLGRAVVKIRRADGACGTGFLVSADVLLTNHHVLPDVATAERSVAMADYEAPAPGASASSAVRHVEVALKPDRLFVTEADLDFTFCGVDGLEGRDSIILDRSVAAIGPWEVVNIIQHPRGRPKEVALRDNQVVKADGVVLHYVCDTEPGSSGSPVFDNHWRLVALHHASVAAEISPRWSPKQAASAPQYLNEGVRLAALALWLESDGPERDGSVALERVRDLFRGADPRAGLFGALGRSPGGRSSAELVADPSDRGGEVLDIAYWDLRALRGRPMDSLHDLVPIMDALGMDVWLLANASPALARALAENLQTWFHQPFAVVPGAGPVSVLARADQALKVARETISGLDVAKAQVRGGGRRETSILLVPGVGEASGQVAAMHEANCADLLAFGRPAADLRPSGLERWSAQGSGDGFTLTRSPRSRVARAFASPNLTSPDGTVQIARGRDLIEAAKRVASREPAAARLVLGNGGGGA